MSCRIAPRVGSLAWMDGAWKRALVHECTRQAENRYEAPVSQKTSGEDSVMSFGEWSSPVRSCPSTPRRRTFTQSTRR